MTRELLILRHGKSDWSLNVGDYHRPLVDRGKRGAQRMGIWLWRQELRPDAVISSPAERAIVTAQKACKAMGMGSAGILRDRRIYMADTRDLLEVLHDAPKDASRVMLVGHNPGLEELLEHLADGRVEIPEDGKLLPTATLARLSLSCGWAEVEGGCARLVEIVRPGSLPEGFPFPAPHGEELRDRPAYYYTQSSVLPYRRTAKGVEVLLISSSKKKHYVIPKGIKDPGLTPQASAAKEAREEAGVEGVVDERIIGSYRYEKWGATCTVDVYPMEVTRVIPESEWREKHRGRRWVSAEKGAEMVKQAELKPMLTDFPGWLERGDGASAGRDG